MLVFFQNEQVSIYRWQESHIYDELPNEQLSLHYRQICRDGVQLKPIFESSQPSKPRVYRAVRLCPMVLEGILLLCSEQLAFRDGIPNGIRSLRTIRLSGRG